MRLNSLKLASLARKTCTLDSFQFFGTYLHSVLTRCIMNRKLRMRNSILHDNPQTYTNFCGKIVCFSLLWWNKSSILLIFGKELIISIVSTYSCPKLEQINRFK